MTTQQDIAFETLLQRWSRHQDLRKQGAPFADLVASRARLDEARLDCARMAPALAAPVAA